MNPCARVGHDWGWVVASGPMDPRRGHGRDTRPGDKCRRCGKERVKKINWDEEQPSNQPVHVIHPRYRDRSKYRADGRKK